MAGVLSNQEKQKRKLILNIFLSLRLLYNHYLLYKPAACACITVSSEAQFLLQDNA